MNHSVRTGPEPAYRSMPLSALEARVQAGLEELSDCRACPRDCRVDRLRGELGVCRTGRHAVVSSAFAHRGEEDCLRGWRGSGTIFFTLCNLRCVFCQNWDISQRREGETMGADRIADLMLGLQDEGCHNINLVTPDHVVPQVVEAIAAAVKRGLSIPIVYNTSAYDSVASLRLLEGLVDIYLPDFKVWHPGTARRLLKADDYPDRARAAIREMHMQVGPLVVGDDGLAHRGVLVRHLVMPGQIDEAKAIFAWLAEALGPETYVNIMGHYRPLHRVGSVGRDGTVRFPDIGRRPTPLEIEQVFAHARSAGLRRLEGA